MFCDRAIFGLGDSGFSFENGVFRVRLMASDFAADLPTLPDFKPETLRGTSGYFRAGQTHGGVWWFLDPDGVAFFSRGVTAVNRAGTAGGRWARRGPYADTVDRRFGTADPRPFVEDVVQRLRRWNFNTLGAWTTPEFLDAGLPCTEILDFRRASEHGFRLGPANLPDVFDPRWAADCDRCAGEVCGPRRESRSLIGYFTDHALGWAQESEGTGGRPTLLQLCLSLEPSCAAYHAAWEFVLAPHGGEFEALAQAWGVDWPNKAALRQLTLEERAVTTAGYCEDQRRFSREFARRYFSVTTDAIRRHDPHHLILGCRFNEPLPALEILQACMAPQVDVVSFNAGRREVRGSIEALHRATGCPVLLGEFSWSGEEFWKTRLEHEPPGLSRLERMLRRGRASLEAAGAHPALLGYAWNRWVQGDPAEIPPFASGLVYTNDLTAHEHVEPLAAINTGLECVHAGRPASGCAVVGL